MKTTWAESPGDQEMQLTKEGGFGCGEGGGCAGGRSEQYRPTMGKAERRIMMIKITYPKKSFSIKHIWCDRLFYKK